MINLVSPAGVVEKVKSQKSAPVGVVEKVHLVDRERHPSVVQSHYFLIL
jgi:hypothetical protein